MYLSGNYKQIIMSLNALKQMTWHSRQPQEIDQRCIPELNTGGYSVFYKVTETFSFKTEEGALGQLLITYF